jgi:hypothetical protein
MVVCPSNDGNTIRFRLSAHSNVVLEIIIVTCPSDIPPEVAWSVVIYGSIVSYKQNSI